MDLLVYGVLLVILLALDFLPGFGRRGRKANILYGVLTLCGVAGLLAYSLMPDTPALTTWIESVFAVITG